MSSMEVSLIDDSDNEFSRTYTPNTRNKRNVKLELVRKKVTKIIKNNFEPSEVPLSILRATFYLIEAQKRHEVNIIGGEYSLPTFHKTFLYCYKKKQKGLLIQIVKAICYVPKESEDEYLNWLNEERTRRQPNVNTRENTIVSERGLQVGSFGYNKIVKLCQTALVYAPAKLSQYLSIETWAYFSSLQAILWIGGGVTGLYSLCKIGYNIYRVKEHGRSTKFATKDILENVGSLLVANGATLALYFALAGSLGATGAGALAVALGVGVYWTGSYAFEWICRKMLNVSKDEYLDKAYRHLGVTQKATLVEIGQCYRKLSRDNHEDKVRGKSKKEIEEHKRTFLKTQFAMAMIRAAIEKNKEDYATARENFKKVDTEEYGVDYGAVVSSWAANKFKSLLNFGKRLFTRRSKRNEQHHPIILEITSGYIPYEMFLEEDEYEEFLRHMQLRRQNDLEGHGENNCGKSAQELETEELESFLTSL